MKTIKLLPLLVLLVLTVDAFAQQRNTRNNQQNRRGPSLSIGFQVVQPLDEFKSYYDGNPVGIGGAFLINGGRSPFEFGVGYSWQSMGKSEESIRIYEGDDVDGDPVYGSGEMTVNSNIHTYQVIARFKPLTGKVQPYVDGIAGIKAFTTKTSILADSGSYSEVIDEDKAAKDVSAAYGWAAGLKLEVARGFMLEGRVETVRGGETKFVNPESVEISREGDLTYEINTSKTNAMIYQIGFSLEF